ncbi:MAG TPA: hypothetical protein EYQ81_07980, partial [Sneathiellales bacterium]|nr:hypothetical protein [Sneathiellales bacterium]
MDIGTQHWYTPRNTRKKARKTSNYGQRVNIQARPTFSAVPQISCLPHCLTVQKTAISPQLTPAVHVVAGVLFHRERPTAMANILSLTSHVVHGHVGGQASGPAWQAMGHEGWHLPTVLFSNHPGHGGYRGGPVAVGLQNQLLDGLMARDFLAGCGALHTGYLGQAGSVDVALRAMDGIEGL